MNRIAKLGLAALMLGGAGSLVAAPADAGVSVGVSVGVPGPVYAHPCARPFRFRPAYCGYPVYAEPFYVGGVVYHGPVYYRVVGGGREFWFNNGWHRDRDDFHPAFHHDGGDMHR